MSLYFIEKNGAQSGPYTLDELRSQKISSTTLVWKEGIPDWKQAEEFEELKGLIIPTPPPLPGQRKVEVYDSTYQKDTHALILGVTIILVNLYFRFKWDSLTKTEFNFFAIINLISFITAVVTVISSAKRQNRNTSILAVFSIFTPPIALICIGLTNKKLFQKKEPEKLKEETIDESVTYMEHTQCPACSSTNVLGKDECPDCGLRLR